jgi:hypothetical protein
MDGQKVDLPIPAFEERFILKSGHGLSRTPGARHVVGPHGRRLREPVTDGHQILRPHPSTSTPCTMISGCAATSRTWRRGPRARAARRRDQRPDRPVDPGPLGSLISLVRFSSLSRRSERRPNLVAFLLTKMGKKESSSKLSTLASKILSGDRKPILAASKRLASSVKSQDERKGQRK